MATAIRTIGHEDRLSLVDHLDELRTRLIVSAVALALALGVCLWQNHALLKIINAPVVKQTQKQVAKGNGTVGQAVLAQKGLLGVAITDQQVFRALAAVPALSAARTELLQAAAANAQAVAKIPRTPMGDKPVTLGVGEPFTTTITISLYFALIVSLPVILFQLYSFVLPAFSPKEKRIAKPLMLAIPVLFVIGVLFGYFVVLPAAVRFFTNFNSSEFNVLIQANPYYKFEALIVLAMGLIFQVPVGILAVTRLGIVTPAQLAKQRRYAIVLCAAVAAFLPGDAITLVLETVPLYVLFETSILVAKIVARRDAKREAREAAAGLAGLSSTVPGAGAVATAGAPAGASAPAPGPAPTSAAPTSAPLEPDVQDIIDHIDDSLSD